MLMRFKLRHHNYVISCKYVYMLIDGWGCLTGTSMSIALAFALRACERAMLRARDGCSVARGGRTNLWVSVPPSVRPSVRPSLRAGPRPGPGPGPAADQP